MDAKSRNHRPRKTIGKITGELTITPLDYSKAVRTILSYGYHIKIDKDGYSSLCDLTKEHLNDWGFDN